MNVRPLAHYMIILDYHRPLFFFFFFCPSNSAMFFVARGLDLRRNAFEQTPLHAACVSGNIEVVQRLVQGGADTNAQDAAEVRDCCCRAWQALGGGGG